MIRLAVLVILAIELANGQLNYEGNPFTEYTEYIAEESNLSENSARKIDASLDLPTAAVSSRPQKLYPVVEPENRRLHQATKAETASRQFQDSSGNSPISHAHIALNSFLNSRTPEESRLSLDHYLRSQNPPEDQSRSSDTVIEQDISQSLQVPSSQPISQVQQQQSLVPHVQQQQSLVSHVQQQSLVPHVPQQQSLVPHVPQQQSLVPHVQQPQQVLVPQVSQQQQVPLPSQVDQVQLIPQNDQRQQLLPSAGQAYGYVGQPAVVQAVQPVIRTPAGVVLGQKMLQPVPLVPAYQGRNDIMSAMWRERMRRIRGKHFPFAQPRIAPALYQGPIAVPIKAKAPVEVIYTKPPGLHRGPPILSNPPVPYEDASAWFPETDQPPSHKDVYYSQLYAQSYDPHYYNYIAATGKIRPYLYGKLGKHQEEQDDGIWSELYRGFKKHGLKNIMTPTFLLGMTLPVVTLMLSALVQKRSIARSDGARDLKEDALQEYLERLQRAMECYGRNSRDAKSDEC